MSDFENSMKEEMTTKGKIVWWLEMFIQGVIFYSIGMYFIELQFGDSEHSREGFAFFLWSERVVASIFTVEYITRWITFKGKWWKYPFQPMAIVDLIAVLPFYIGFMVDLRSLRLIRTLRVLRLLKIYRYNLALQSFIKSYHSVKGELFILMVVIGILVFFSATVMYECERHAQPEVFAKYTDSIWWSVVTLTTVGYGDKYPITEVGRWTAMITLVFGLGVFGTFLSLIGSAFINTMQERLTLRLWEKTCEKLKTVCVANNEPVDDELMQAMADEAIHSHFDHLTVTTWEKTYDALRQLCIFREEPPDRELIQKMIHDAVVVAYGEEFTKATKAASQKTVVGTAGEA